jgi:phosphoglycerate dehydrogenase-like enzyme
MRGNQAGRTSGVSAADMRFRIALYTIFLCLTAAVAQAQTAAKKIVVIGLGDNAVAELKRSAPPNVQVVAAADGQIAAEVADADGLITPKLTADLLRAAPKLKWAQILNAGVEDAIPLVKGTDVTVTNLKVVLGPEVADHAMGLLLALTRGLYETIPARKWEVPSNVSHITELDGKTCVILGFGGVGTQIAQRAAGFGMTILAVDPKDMPKDASAKAPPFSLLKQLVKPDQLDSVLPQADVVFVTVPETSETKGMIGAKQFGEMKQGSYFVAVSRGTVYSTDALVAALASKHLAGAGLDATDPEPLPADSPLWKFENVLITPHIAGASDQAGVRVFDLLRENIRLFAEGKPLINTVDKTKGY